MLILATGSLADGLFGVILVVNSLIGIVQELLAKRKLDRLALLNRPTAHVIRDGVTREIPIGDVVLGDLLELRTGDQVPADGPVRASRGLELDESNLTGESDAVPKGAGDRVQSGTAVVAGSGTFVAAAVGPDAYANQIAAQVRKFTRVRSEIQSSINRLLKWITWVIVLALPLQIISQVRAVGDQGWREVVIRSTGGLVGLIPEGLVLLTSVAFLLSAVKLTRQQVLVQELPAVEGLARVDVVCLDKTGTLTVGDIVLDEIIPLGDVPAERLRAALGALADDDNANATLAAVRRAVPSPDGWSRCTTVPFNSARKWSAADFGEHGAWVLGAPDVLLPPGDPVRAQVSELAASGRRVLLLAVTSEPLDGPRLPGALSAAALVTLTEQIRPDAAQTLHYFAEQGVQIKVISGDNPQTVGAIARVVGVEVGEVVDARELPDDPDALRETAATTTVFGRVSPEQKRALVQALQADGHVVAMTGDGVNDALALKDADIGVAMGNGTQATKTVAQLVLLDGKFSHLPSVLAEGRRVIGNVERVANRFLTKNVMSLVASQRRGGRAAVPVPAASPDPRQRRDDRHPGVLPCARSQHPQLPSRVPATRAALQHPGRADRRPHRRRVLPAGQPLVRRTALGVRGPVQPSRPAPGCSRRRVRTAGDGRDGGAAHRVLRDPDRARATDAAVEGAADRVDDDDRGAGLRAARGAGVFRLRPAGGARVAVVARRGRGRRTHRVRVVVGAHAG